MNTSMIGPRPPGPEPDGTLTAFCATCPAPDDVAQVLKALGLRLVFAQPADDDKAYLTGLPPLPAQYHFEDEVGTGVAYLAGADAPCLADDEDLLARPYPPHASRFWLTPGGYELATRRVQETLAVRFRLAWLALYAVEPNEDAA